MRAARRAGLSFKAMSVIRALAIRERSPSILSTLRQRHLPEHITGSNNVEGKLPLPCHTVQADAPCEQQVDEFGSIPGDVDTLTLLKATIEGSFGDPLQLLSRKL